MRQEQVSPVPANSPEKRLQGDQEKDWLVSVSQVPFVKMLEFWDARMIGDHGT